MASNNPLSSIGRSSQGRLIDKRSLYNERLSFHQNTNVSIIESSSRSTRYRAKKRRKFLDKSNESSGKLDSEAPRPLETPGTSPESNVGHETFEDVECDHLLEYVHDSTVNVPVASNEEICSTYEFDDNYSFEANPLSLEAEFHGTELSESRECYYEDLEDSCHGEGNSYTSIAASNEAALLLYEGAPLTSSASNILVMQFKVRHNLTDQSLEDLLRLLQLHCPKPNHVPNSLYHFKKFFRESRYQIKYHYYCSKCLQGVTSSDTTCVNSACKITFEEIGAKCSFIEVPIESQLATLFARNGFYDAIVKNMQNYKSRAKKGVYTDIYDGSLYQQLVLKKYTDSPSNISVIFNTDGFPVFRSSGFAFWPLYLLINELPYQMRVAKQNRIFAGLWYGCAKPEMTLFLEPMAQSIKKLYLKGVKLTLPNGESLLCRMALICTTVDLPARAIVANIVQFNGYWGCCHCLQKGQRVACSEKGTTHTYPFIEENPCGPLRNHQQTCQDAELAVKQNKHINGVKGPTWLSIIPSFDVTQGMAVDYMHCILLGVCRLLLRLWLQSSYHKKAWYIGTKSVDLDVRHCGIKPPNEIQRTPRSISSTLKYWKAHELRAWLLHYSPVVLYKVLPEEYYQHHLLLVEATYLLLKDIIKANELEQSLLLLQHYCFMFAPLYGEEHMTANVHCLLHLPKCVETLGPLWGNSCFPFETANAHILKLFHGSQSVEKQVIQQIITQQLLPAMAEEKLPSDTSINSFFEQMGSELHHNRKTFKIDNEFSLLGNSHIVSLTDTERELFIQAGFNDPPTTVSTYSAFLILKTKRIIQAAPTSRSKKRDNSCLSFTTGFGILQKIISIENPIPKCFLIVTKLQSASSQLCTDDITHSQFNQHFKCFIPPRASQQVVVSLKNVMEKCVFMDMEAQMGYVFISLLPNGTEME